MIRNYTTGLKGCLPDFEASAGLLGRRGILAGLCGLGGSARRCRCIGGLHFGDIFFQLLDARAAAGMRAHELTVGSATAGGFHLLP